MIQTLKPQPVLNVAEMGGDLCDRCGAAAKLRARLSTSGTLAFCGHHANRFTDRIAASATEVDVEAGFSWRGAEGDGN